ncbi:zinc finger, CCHC-type [Artemisia annua]|uniref:Zinc finger, CCHC-type n=1 Tax=Artemisia annua TaxID=35608 RepID=A0A2U1MMZ8_ARTAN|nr:zinc finger, CCHC-type [Artemisia annua]
MVQSTKKWCRQWYQSKGSIQSREKEEHDSIEERSNQRKVKREKKTYPVVRRRNRRRVLAGEENRQERKPNQKDMSGDKNENNKVVYREVAAPLASYQCPVLNNMKYTLWALRMKKILLANGVWDLVEGTSTSKEIDVKKDNSAII